MLCNSVQSFLSVHDEILYKGLSSNEFLLGLVRKESHFFSFLFLFSFLGILTICSFVIFQGFPMQMEVHLTQ